MYEFGIKFWQDLETTTKKRMHENRRNKPAAADEDLLTIVRNKVNLCTNQQQTVKP
jgi:hypothetical protein